MPTVPDIHRRGTRADQAIVASPPLTVGTLYFVTDEGVTERWDGAVWETYGGVGGTPGAHAASHQSGGSDPIALDTLAAPTDVTTLNASAGAHGLLRKLSGTATEYLDGSGAWTTPAGSAAITQLTGDVTAGPGSGSQAATIAAAAVTYAKIQDVTAASRLLGRGSASGSGDVEEITLGTNLSLSGTTLNATGGSLTTQQKTRAITVVFGTGSAVITAGLQTYVSCPYTGTITAARLLAVDASVTSGSIVIDVWKDTFANFPPVVGDTITASAKPTLSSATKSDDVTLSGWSTSITAGDVFGFNVDSASTVTQVALQLTLVVS